MDPLCGQALVGAGPPDRGIPDKRARAASGTARRSCASSTRTSTAAPSSSGASTVTAKHRVRSRTHRVDRGPRALIRLTQCALRTVRAGFLPLPLRHTESSRRSSGCSARSASSLGALEYGHWLAPGDAGFQHLESSTPRPTSGESTWYSRCGGASRGPGAAHGRRHRPGHPGSVLFGLAVLWVGNPFWAFWIDVANPSVSAVRSMLDTGRIAGLAPTISTLSTQLIVAVPLAFALFLFNPLQDRFHRILRDIALIDAEHRDPHAGAGVGPASLPPPVWELHPSDAVL